MRERDNKFIREDQAIKGGLKPHFVQTEFVVHNFHFSIVSHPENSIMISVVISVAFEIDRSRNHLPTLLYKLVYKLDRVYNGLF